MIKILRYPIIESVFSAGRAFYKTLGCAFFLPALGLIAGCSTPVNNTANQNSSKKISFTKHTLTNEFIAEGVAVGDVNKDGLIDVLAGAYWFQAPDWVPHEIMQPKKYEYDKGYSDAFLSHSMDVNFDGWIDFLVVGYPGREAYWYENPQGKPGHWKQHLIHNTVSNESPGFFDIDGDGRIDLLAGNSAKKQMTWFKSPSSAGNLEWKAYPISSEGHLGSDPFSHGLGMGDINGDGRPDVIITAGWWEAPQDVFQGNWVFHEAKLGEPAAQMYAYDFDGDGDNDVVSSSAHAFGIWWHEQLKDDKGQLSWKTHLITDTLSQTHGLAFTDMNKDGLPDLVTGMRYFAHMGHDPGELNPPVLYWFEFKKGSTPTWVAHYIDNNSGVGLQVKVEDITGDGLKDLIIANKKGVFVFKQNEE